MENLPKKMDNLMIQTLRPSSRTKAKNTSPDDKKQPHICRGQNYYNCPLATGYVSFNNWGYLGMEGTNIAHESAIFAENYLKSWVAGRIDRCSVLTIVALSTKGQIVCRSQMPDELAVGILANQVTEVFAMVIFVVGKAIEYHTTVHFLYILWLDL